MYELHTTLTLTLTLSAKGRQREHERDEGCFCLLEACRHELPQVRQSGTDMQNKARNNRVMKNKIDWRKVDGGGGGGVCVCVCMCCGMVWRVGSVGKEADEETCVWFCCLCLVL